MGIKQPIFRCSDGLIDAIEQLCTIMKSALSKPHPRQAVETSVCVFSLRRHDVNSTFVVLDGSIEISDQVKDISKVAQATSYTGSSPRQLRQLKGTSSML